MSCEIHQVTTGAAKIQDKKKATAKARVSHDGVGLTCRSSTTYVSLVYHLRFWVNNSLGKLDFNIEISDTL